MTDVLRLLHAYVSKAAPSTASVEFQASPDADIRLPLILIGTSNPVSIGNRREAATRVTALLSCYDIGLTAAYDLAQDLEQSIYDLWRSGYTTEYGGVSHISITSAHPTVAACELPPQDCVRVDFTITATLRPPHDTNN